MIHLRDMSYSQILWIVGPSKVAHRIQYGEVYDANQILWFIWSSNITQRVQLEYHNGIRVEQPCMVSFLGA